MIDPAPSMPSRLSIPPGRPGLLVRPRLLERLAHAAGHRLVLVSATAGAGKTTLLAGWARAAGRPVAWLSLDERDNDLPRFFAALIAALQTLAPGIEDDALALLRQPQPIAGEAFLAALLADLANLPPGALLVLDDYHLITRPEIHAALTTLIEHFPEQRHLVLLTRADPPLPLARLRARGQLGELREADLRFTSDEAARFFTQAFNLNLPSESLQQVVQRTEGWAAGLYLAGLSLSGAGGGGEPGPVLPGAGLPGTANRFILDYLLEEVLARQPAEVQGFLLRTAILRTFSAPLAAALLSGPDAAGEPASTHRQAHGTLAYLERANLFVVPLDEQRHWFRYHTLFAGLLRHRLEQELPPAEVAALYLRAAEWCAANQLLPDAFDYALAAGQDDLAARVLVEMAGPMLVAGEVAALAGLIERLPLATRDTQPEVNLFWAWCQVLSGRAEGVEAALARMESAQPSSDTDLAAWRSQAVALRSFTALLAGDSAATVRGARQALAGLPAGDHLLRGILAANLGSLYHAMGDLDQARLALETAHAASLTAGNRLTALSAADLLAQVHAEQGRLAEAQRDFQAVIAAAGRSLPAAGLSRVWLAGLLYELDDLPAAARSLDEALDILPRFGQPESLVVAGLWRGMVALAEAGPAAAAFFLAQARQAQAEARNPAIALYLAALEARFWLLQDEIAPALEWAGRLDPTPAGLPALLSAYRGYTVALTLARTLWVAGRPTPAAALLAGLLPHLDSTGRRLLQAEALALQALIEQDLGRQPAAARLLLAALQFAAPEGAVRTFVDFGRPLLTLLGRLLAAPALPAGVPPAYPARLVERLRLDLARRRQPAAPPVIPGLAEPLSARELEVLRLVAAGLSNRDIAATLVVTTGTVKKHLNNLFGKLVVESRTQAIQRARELNLL